MDVRSSRSGPPCHRVHGREGQRAPDGWSDATGREPSPSDSALCPLLTRGAPEQREPHSLLTDIEWTPRGLVTLRKPMAARRAASQNHQKATEGSPAHPRDPRTGTPAQQAQSPRRPRCARNDRTTHQASSPTSDPHPCQRAEHDPQRDSPPPDSQRRLHHLRPGSDPTLSYEAREGPSTHWKQPVGGVNHQVIVSSILKNIRIQRFSSLTLRIQPHTIALHS